MDGQQALEKMLNIVNYWRNANQKHNKVWPHTGQNGHRQGIYKLRILERVWRKDSPPILLVKIWIDAGIMENSMEVSYETRNRPYYTI